MKIVDSQALKAELEILYADLSKHSVYQSIPGFVAEKIGYQVSINEDWRGDKVRLDYILRRLGDAGHPSWGDFGANTGFFSLSLAHDHPDRKVLAIEANPNHADFIRKIAEVFELRNLEVLGRPVALDDLASLPPLDVLLHLNVLHHAGADFDKGLVTGTDDFLPYAVDYLQRLRSRCRILVFQMGTNLWGDKAKPIIDFRADAAKLEMLTLLLARGGWRIEDVAYATRRAGEAIRYESLADVAATTQGPHAGEGAEAILRGMGLDNHIGEFYRRPLFFCSPSS